MPPTPAPVHCLKMRVNYSVFGYQDMCKYEIHFFFYEGCIYIFGLCPNCLTIYIKPWKPLAPKYEVLLDKLNMSAFQTHILGIHFFWLYACKKKSTTPDSKLAKNLPTVCPLMI